MPDEVFAEIISTGTEILQGLYPDINAQWLSGRLGELNVPVLYHHAVRDDRAATADLLRQAAARAALVVMTGGLGPTEDDLNRFVAAEVCGRECRLDERAAEMMRERFARRGRTFPESNLIQALIPEGAITLYNDWGTAPGFIVPREAGRAALVALPGPPREMRPLFDRRVAPWIAETFPATEVSRLRTVRTCGRPESEINELLRDLFERDANVTVGLRAQMGMVDVRITARAVSNEAATALNESFVSAVRERLGAADIYGYDDDALEDAVARLLTRSGRRVACAESCTAGGIAARLTNVAGSSEYFNESYITYSNEAKRRVLGVRAEILEAHGAVSGEVAAEMAEGVRRISGADFGLSVTGIAGPTGGTAGKPVGLTWFGLASAGATYTERHIFAGDRRENRDWAARVAVDILRRRLERAAE